MVIDHTVFRGVEKMVEKMLMPRGSMSFGKTTETACEKVHVQEGYLGPRIESWWKAES